MKPLFFQPDLSQALIQVFTGSGIRVSFRMCLVHTTVEAGKAHLAFWMKEEWNGEPGSMPHCAWRIHYTVRG